MKTEPETSFQNSEPGTSFQNSEPGPSRAIVAFDPKKVKKIFLKKNFVWYLIHIH